MLTQALLQWLHEGRILAGRLPEAAPERTAWVGIYPLNRDRPGTRELLQREGIAILPGVEVPIYRIRVFELADSLRDTFFTEADLERTQSVIVLGDEALCAKLRDLNVPLSILDSPKRMDYPP